MSYTVYRHTAPNGKSYIGITSLPAKERWRNGTGYSSNVLFYRAIKKYGWENIAHEILLTGLTKEEAEREEMDLIKRYELTDPNKGYNIQYGGAVVGTMTAEQREKIRKRQSGANSLWYGKPAYNRGVPATEEQRRKTSEARKGKGTGERNVNYRRQYSDEERAVLGTYKRGKPDSEETKQRKREAQLKIVRKESKAVININTGTVYKSKGEAARDTGICVDSIMKCCKGKRRKAGGFYWAYFFEGVSYVLPEEIPKPIKKEPLTRRSEETRQKMREARAKQGATRGRAVTCLDNQKTYRDAVEAGKDTACDPSSIRKVCKGEYKQTKGLRFAFAEQEATG